MSSNQSDEKSPVAPPRTKRVNSDSAKKKVRCSVRPVAIVRPNTASADNYDVQQNNTSLYDQSILHNNKHREGLSQNTEQNKLKSFVKVNPLLDNSSKAKTLPKSSLPLLETMPLNEQNMLNKNKAPGKTAKPSVKPKPKFLASQSLDRNISPNNKPKTKAKPLIANKPIAGRDQRSQTVPLQSNFKKQDVNRMKSKSFDSEGLKQTEKFSNSLNETLLETKELTFDNKDIKQADEKIKIDDTCKTLVPSGSSELPKSQELPSSSPELPNKTPNPRKFEKSNTMETSNKNSGIKDNGKSCKGPSTMAPELPNKKITKLKAFATSIDLPHSSSEDITKNEQLPTKPLLPEVCREPSHLEKRINFKTKRSQSLHDLTDINIAEKTDDRSFTLKHPKQNKSLQYENVTLSKISQQPKRDLNYENVELKNKKEDFKWVATSFDNGQYKPQVDVTTYKCARSPTKRRTSSTHDFAFPKLIPRNENLRKSSTPSLHDKESHHISNEENLDKISEFSQPTAINTNSNIFYNAPTTTSNNSIYSDTPCNTPYQKNNTETIYAETPSNLPIQKNVLAETIYAETPSSLPIQKNVLPETIYAETPTNLPIQKKVLAETIYSETPSNLPIQNKIITESNYAETPSNILKESTENGDSIRLPQQEDVLRIDRSISLDDTEVNWCSSGLYNEVVTQPLSNNNNTPDQRSDVPKRLTASRKISPSKPPRRRSTISSLKEKRTVSDTETLKQDKYHQYEGVNIKSKQDANESNKNPLYDGAQKEILMLWNETLHRDSSFEISSELLDIQNRFIYPLEMAKPGRVLIKQGVLQKLSRKESQQRVFILLSDALLYCTEVGHHNQLKLILELPLSQMSIDLPDSEDLKNEFTMISTKRSFLLNTNSVEERDEWVKALKEAIGNAESDDSTSQSSIRNDIGDAAPPWIPDSRVSMCQICTTKFNVYTRRHHCRACGKVVCSNCSSFEAPLKYMNNEVARVCERCFSHLQFVFQYEDDDDYEAMETLRAKFKDLKKKKHKRNKKERSKTMEINFQDVALETSGFLKFKKGNKKEKQYWCVLKNHVLHIYKAFSDPIASYSTPVLGYEVSVLGDWLKDGYSFQLTHKSTSIEAITLRADDEDAAKRWIDYLRMATVVIG